MHLSSHGVCANAAPQDPTTDCKPNKNTVNNKQKTTNKQTTNNKVQTGVAFLCCPQFCALMWSLVHGEHAGAARTRAGATTQTVPSPRKSERRCGPGRDSAPYRSTATEDGQAFEEDHELNYTAMIRTHPPPQAADTVHFSMDVDEVPAAVGSRPDLLSVVSGLYERFLRLTVEQIVDCAPVVPFPRCACAADGERRGCRRPGPMPRGYLGASSSGSGSRASRWGPPGSCPAGAGTAPMKLPVLTGSSTPRLCVSRRSRRTSSGLSGCALEASWWERRDTASPGRFFKYRAPLLVQKSGYTGALRIRMLVISISSLPQRVVTGSLWL